MIETMPHAVPTTVVGVMIDRSKRRGELVARMGEAANHDDRRTHHRRRLKIPFFLLPLSWKSAADADPSPSQ
jgi:hypothetical protein